MCCCFPSELRSPIYVASPPVVVVPPRRTFWGNIFGHSVPMHRPQPLFARGSRIQPVLVGRGGDFGRISSFATSRMPSCAGRSYSAAGLGGRGIPGIRR